MGRFTVPKKVEQINDCLGSRWGIQPAGLSLTAGSVVPGPSINNSVRDLNNCIS